MSKKQELRKLIDKIKTRNFREGEAKGLISSIQEEQSKVLRPVLEEIARESSGKMVESFKEAVSKIEVKVPEIQVPKADAPNVDTNPIAEAIFAAFRKIKIPPPEVTVTIPEIKVPSPTVNVPETVFPDRMKIEGFDYKHPLPVILTDGEGKPYVSMFTGGNSNRISTIKDILDSTGESIIDEVNHAIRISGSITTTPGGVTYASDAVGSVNVVQSVTLDVKQLSGSADSVNVVGFTSSVATVPTNTEGVAYNSDNPFPVDATVSLATAVISGLNSTVSTLAAGSRFTGEWQDVLDYGIIYSTVISNVASTTLGYRIDFSDDGSTERGSTDRYTVAANTLKEFAFNPAMRYFRVVYDNGGTDQATFALQTIMKLNGLPSSHRADDVINDENDTQLIKGILTGKDILSGTYNNVNSFQPTAGVNAILTYPYQNYGSGEITGLTPRFVQATDAVSSVNIVSQAVVLEVRQVSGGMDSVAIEAQDVTLDVKQLSGSVDSVSVVTQPITFDVKQLSGSTDSMSFVSQTIGMEVKQVSGFTDSVFITGSSGTTMSVGNVVADAADDGSAPVKTGGIARTTNPTAMADGDRISSAYDDLGRQLVTPFQIRDLRVTAYVSLSTGTETTLLAASAGAFHDLVQIIGANQSSAAVQVDIRAVTGGNIVMTLYIPANSTAGATLTLPWPQDATGNNWTADLPDITGTTVNLSALFTREV